MARPRIHIVTFTDEQVKIEKWVTERNSKPVKINWQLRTPDERIKLVSLYPEI